MKNLKKISLEDEINREGKQIEEEIRADRELEDIKVSDDLEASLFSKIQEYECDKKVKTIVRKKKRRTYVLVAIAAVLVMLFGSVITAVGSKSYEKSSSERDNGDESSDILNVEDMEAQKTEDIDEINVYKEIKQKLGFFPVRMLDKPQAMCLESYKIDEEQKKVVLFYTYKGEIIRYSMYMNNSDSSFGQKELDDLVDTYEVENMGYTITVNEYQVKNKNIKRYVAEFEVLDVEYQIMGSMDKKEFNQILEKLFFKNA